MKTLECLNLLVKIICSLFDASGINCIIATRLAHHDCLPSEHVDNFSCHSFVHVYRFCDTGLYLTIDLQTVFHSLCLDAF